MLDEIDAALRSLLGTELPGGTVIRCQPPDPARAPGEVTLSLFPHQITEDLGTRTGYWTEQRDHEGAVVGRRSSLRRYQVHYLVVATADDITVERHLLGAALTALASNDVLATEHLSGSLLATGLPVSLAVAHPDLPGLAPELRVALGLAGTTSLDVLVTAAMMPTPTTELTRSPDRIDLGMTGRRPVVAAERPRKVPERRISEQL